MVLRLISLKGAPLGAAHRAAVYRVPARLGGGGWCTLVAGAKELVAVWREHVTPGPGCARATCGTCPRRPEMLQLAVACWHWVGCDCGHGACLERPSGLPGMLKSPDLCKGACILRCAPLSVLNAALSNLRTLEKSAAQHRRKPSARSLTIGIGEALHRPWQPVCHSVPTTLGAHREGSTCNRPMRNSKPNLSQVPKGASLASRLPAGG